MRKISFLTLLLLIFSASVFAQRNNISPEIQAERDMLGLERKILKENTDTQGVELINNHLAAKKKMDAEMKKLPGYGKAATDKASLQKFREKNAKKEPSFNTLSENELKAKNSKEDYLTEKYEEYKKWRAISAQ